jgi:hypothetical protein
MITAQEIQALRERCAGYDMTKARKSKGGIAITQTALGNLDVTYNPATKEYTVSNFNTGELYVQGGAKVAKAFIAAQYVVTVE